MSRNVGCISKETSQRELDWNPEEQTPFRNRKTAYSHQDWSAGRGQALPHTGDWGTMAAIDQSVNPSISPSIRV